MTDSPVPLPRRASSTAGDGPTAEAVPIRGRRAVAVLDVPVLDVPVLDVPAPPWLRAPAPPRVRLTAVPEPVPEPVAVHRPPVLRARPRVGAEADILGLSRRSRGRWGSRLFTLFFLAVYALILGQLVFTLVHG